MQVKSKYAESKASSKDAKGKVSNKSDIKSKHQEPMDTETASEYVSMWNCQLIKLIWHIYC